MTEHHTIATRTMDTKASAQALGAAIKARYRIHLHADSDADDQTLSGVIVGGGDTQLVVDVSPLDHRARLLLASPVLYASIDSCDGRYVFKTRCAATTADTDAHLLRLARPATIAVVERRRSRRHLFREPTEVVFHPAGPGSGRRCKAEMLNLSTAGIACRVREADPGPMSVGQTVHVAFCLGSEGRRFELTARIVNWIKAATPGHAVLGMEFIEDENLQANRAPLRQGLADPN